MGYLCFSKIVLNMYEIVAVADPAILKGGVPNPE